MGQQMGIEMADWMASQMVASSDCQLVLMLGRPVAERLGCQLVEWKALMKVEQSVL
jgi:hypothetical protein